MSTPDLFHSNISPIFPSGQRMEPAIGDDGEMVQRAAILQIKNNLPGAVAYIQNLWDARDREYSQMMDTKFEPVNIDLPAQDGYYTGARPSLVESPVHFWPSITARCNNAKPSAEQLDQIDVIDLDLFIEILCKAGPVPQSEIKETAGIEAEGAVDAQVQRLTAAVQGCISIDKSLGAVVQRIARPPIIRPSKPFTRPESTGGTGDYYVFMGKQLNYIVTKHLI